MAADSKRPPEKARWTGQWAVTMTKVRIRQVLARTRWQLVTFRGRYGGESRGIVDLIAVRKDHRMPTGTLDRGDALQIILIQVKGGVAAKPTVSDWERLQTVAWRHGATECLLGVWKKGKAAQFFKPRVAEGTLVWTEVEDLKAIFR